MRDDDWLDFDRIWLRPLVRRRASRKELPLRQKKCANRIDRVSFIGAFVWPVALHASEA